MLLLYSENAIIQKIGLNDTVCMIEDSSGDVCEHGSVSASGLHGECADYRLPHDADLLLMVEHSATHYCTVPLLYQMTSRIQMLTLSVCKGISFCRLAK